MPRSQSRGTLYCRWRKSLGYCIHRVAYLYVHSKANKPAHYAPRNVDKKIARFIKALPKLRGGELSLIAVAASLS